MAGRRLGRRLAAQARRFSGGPVIPVVDLAGTDPAAALHRACRDVGFFHLVNTGIPASLALQARELARQFFERWPDRLKQRMAREPSPGGRFGVGRGYQPLGDNTTAGEPDGHEAVDLLRELGPGHRLAGRIGPLDGRNQLPSHALDGCEPATLEQLGLAGEFDRMFGPAGAYQQAMIELGGRVIQVLGQSLLLRPDQQDSVFGGTCRDSFWILRLISYPPVRGPAAVGCGAHTDYGCLTLVNADSTPGSRAECLQVRDRGSGEWIGVSPLEPGEQASFVCNIGDMVELWTAGLYRATPHRVMAPVFERDGPARVSVPFFMEPAFDDVVSPLPQQCLVKAAERHGGGYSARDWDEYQRSRREGQVEQYGTKSEWRDALSVPYGEFVTQKIMTNFDKY